MIILACNGVLVDGRRIAAEVAAQAFTDAGLPVSACAYDLAFCGWPLRDICFDCECQTGHRLPPEFAIAIYQSMQARFRHELTCVAHIEHALAWLRQPRCVISEWPRALTLECLGITGLAKLFGDARIFTREEVRSIHPLSLIARQVDTPPRDCILVTQSPHDIADALRLGMKAIGYSGNPDDDEVHERRLREAGATLVIHDMRRLREAVTMIRDIVSSRGEVRQAAFFFQRS